MWDTLTPADIAAAKRDVGRRRAELLIKQAQEIEGLNTEQADVEALDRLADDFARRFPRPASALAAPAEAPPAPAIEAPVEAPLPAVAEQTPAREVAAAGNNGARRGDEQRAPPRGRQAQQRGYPGTNFDVFSRALARNI
jgi:hypothetical protein